MAIVTVKCTNCGANSNVDNTRDAFVCQYCGSPISFDAALKLMNSSVNINGTNQTIIVNNIVKDNKRFDSEYNITINRPKMGKASMAIYYIEFDGNMFELKNGETIHISSDLKRIDSKVTMRYADGEKRLYHLIIEATGQDIILEIQPTLLSGPKIARCNVKASFYKI